MNPHESCTYIVRDMINISRDERKYESDYSNINIFIFLIDSKNAILCYSFENNFKIFLKLGSCSERFLVTKVNQYDIFNRMLVTTTSQQLKAFS